MFPDTHTFLAQDVLGQCRDLGLTIAVAESCTGGLIAGCLTAVPGSSDVLERGFVTYANEAKTDMLGVSEEMLAEHGAVSEAVARAMADGALSHSNADVTVSITGIAGPGGGSDNKPVGLVHLASARKGHDTLHDKYIFNGSRHEIRLQAVIAALHLLKRQAGGKEPVTI